MTQNRSSAVMQQRSEPHDSLDDFPTPPWATRALCEWIVMTGILYGPCREPAANRGHMVRPLQEYFNQVEGSDIFDYGAGFPQSDYLFGPDPAPVGWTITNPPFRLAEQFIARALRTSTHGVAVIVRSAFLEGQDRHRTLFKNTPPSHILQFTERVVMHKGKLVDPNRLMRVWSKKKQAFVMRKPSSATAYSWLIWMTANTNMPPQMHWIAPCRKRLEKEGDYS